MHRKDIVEDPEREALGEIEDADPEHFRLQQGGCDAFVVAHCDESFLFKVSPVLVLPAGYAGGPGPSAITGTGWPFMQKNARTRSSRAP
jgi:hypothetical protein